MKLYPFAWVGDAAPAAPPRRPAAACWCGARRSQRAGGLEAIRDALIDDCALGALMKRQGPIFLGLTP